MSRFDPKNLFRMLKYPPTHVIPTMRGAVPLPDTLSLKAKVCLLGEARVGKTSLIRKFVLNEFDERYLTTVGTNVSKKTVQLPIPQAGLVVDLDMVIWDIMGQPDYRDLLTDRYFEGAEGILAVADLTQKESLDALFDWIDRVDRVAAQVPVVLALNKADLVASTDLMEKAARILAEAFDGEYYATSAKTGANVEKAFTRLATKIVARGIASAARSA